MVMARAKGYKKPAKIRYTEAQLKELLRLIEEYTAEKDFPTLAGFISRPDIRHKFKITRTYMVDNNDIFEPYIEAMKAKCEDYLIRQGLAGRAIPMTIFMLKQNQYGGYSDSQQLDLNAKTTSIKFVNSVPRPKKSPKA